MKKGIMFIIFALFLAIILCGSASADGNTTIASVATNGTQENSDAQLPDITPDGRYVVYWSGASNLVPGDTNGQCDVFRYDSLNNETIRVSLATDGTQANAGSWAASISDDGRYVSFVSSATNLVTGDYGGYDDVFLRDLLNNQTFMVSVNTTGSQGNGYTNTYSAISGNGRYVTFVSAATNLVTSDTNNKEDIFVRDLQTNTTTRVSVTSSGAQVNGNSYDPDISSDGRYVTFTSAATNLVTGDTNGQDDVFVRDRTASKTYMVSMATNSAKGNSNSNSAAISGNGRYITFTSNSNNLVPGDTNGAWDVFLRDITTNQTTRMTLSSSGAQATSGGYNGKISSDGRYVTFTSYSSNLVSGDTNGVYDVFVRDRAYNITERVSITHNGAQSNGASSRNAVSNNGYVAFESDATNLVPNDTNGKRDIFLHKAETVIDVYPGDSIQSAIDRASSGKMIFVHDNSGSSYNYTENLVINKLLTLNASGNVTIRSNDPNLPVIIINLAGNGTTICGFTIDGMEGAYPSSCLYLNNTLNCSILNNTLTKSYYGLNSVNSSNNNIIGNNVNYITFYAINLENSHDSLVKNNTIFMNENGVMLKNTVNCIIQGNTITHGGYGITYTNSTSNNITGNTINYNIYSGIKFYNSTNSNITGNSFYGNGYGVFSDEFSSNNIISGNTISNSNQIGIILYGKPSQKCQFNTISQNLVNDNMYSGINLFHANNNLITANTLNNNPEGIGLWTSDYNTVSQNSINGSNDWGIRLCGGTLNNTITQNNLNNNTDYGIYIEMGSDNSTISQNNVSNSTYGIYSTSDNIQYSRNSLNGNNEGIYLLSSNNLIFGNLINANQNGITLFNGYNTAVGNTISNNTCYGLCDHAGNLIYNNNFINNAQQTVNSSQSIFYTVLLQNGEYSFVGGNYWSDYAGTDSNGDGFGDDSYLIHTIYNWNNYDHYPYLNKITNVFPGESIHDAINEALSGQTIIIHDDKGLPYTYYGNFILNKPLLIKSAGFVTIKDFLLDTTPVFTINSAGSGSTIQGFNISMDTGVTIWIINSTNNRILDNIITSPNGMAINAENSTHNIMVDNILANHAYGYYMDSSSNNIITTNSMENNSEAILMVNNCNNNIIIGNTFKNNVYGLHLSDSSYNQVYNNNFLNNTAQAQNEGASVGNTFNKNSNIGGNYWSDHISSDANNDGYLDDPYYVGSEQDIYPYIKEISNLVSGDSIQTAIDNASENDKIILHDNGGSVTYEADVTVNKKVNIQADGDVTIQSTTPGTPAFTVLEGGNGSTLEGFDIIAHSPGIFLNNTANVIITGMNITADPNNSKWTGIYLLNCFNITVTNNNIILNTNNSTGNWTGILLENSTSCTIQNNNVTGSQLNPDWCGIKLENNSDNTTIFENNITSCSTGVSLNYSYNNNINDNYISGNNAGILINNAQATVDNNTIENHIADGINVMNSSGNIITNNHITNSGTADGSVAAITLWQSTGNQIRNNTITEGGINLWGSSENPTSENFIEDNEITGHLYGPGETLGNGISLKGASGNFLNGNYIHHNQGYGILIENSEDNQIGGSESSPFNIQYNSLDGTHLDNASGTIIGEGAVSYNGANGIFIINSINIHICFLGVEGNTESGIVLVSSDHNNISHCSIDNNNAGIWITESDNNNVRDNEISNSINTAIGLNLADDNNITGNQIHNNPTGIFAYESNENQVTWNTISNNNFAIDASNSCFNILANNTINNNTINGISVHHYSTNNTISDNNITNNGEFGIALNTAANDNIITRNQMNSNGFNQPWGAGIFLNYVEDVTCTGNEIFWNTVSGNNCDGISLNQAHGNNLTHNNITNNGGPGITNWLSNNNTISDNNVTNNGVTFDWGAGINLLGDHSGHYSEGNKVNNNFVSGNWNFGINLSDANNNTVSCNTVEYNGLGYDWWAEIKLYFADNNTLSDNILFSEAMDIGISMDNASDNQLIDNHISNANRGMEIYQESNNNHFVGNIITNCVSNGISADSSIGNVFSFNQMSGESSNIHISESQETTVNNNNITNVTNGGISVQNCPGLPGVTISNNQLNNTGYYGISVMFSPGSLILNNTIVGTNGIDIYLSTGATIINNTINGSEWYGLEIGESPNCNVSSNNITNAGDVDLSLYNSPECTFSDNHITNNQIRTHTINIESYGYEMGGGVSPGDISGYKQYMDTTNTVNGKPVYYIMDVNGLVIDQTWDIGFLALVNCTDINVTGINMDNSGMGIFIVGSNYTRIGGTLTGETCNFTNNAIGVRLIDCSQVTILNNQIKDNQEGMQIRSSAGRGYNTLMSNIFTNNQQGISIESSPYNTLSGNIITSNTTDAINFGVITDGATAAQINHFRQYIDTTNTINGKPIQYILDASNLNIDENWTPGYLALVNCTNINITGINITNNIQGLLLAGTNNTIIGGSLPGAPCSFSYNREGIYLYRSSYSQILNNQISHNINEGMRTGINLASSSDHNLVKNNKLTDNGQTGIEITGSSYNQVEDNILDQNGILVDGVSQYYIFGTVNNIIARNIITNNSWSGIAVTNSFYNQILNNTLSGNCNITDDYVNWIAAIEISASNNTLVSGNQIINNHRTGINIWDGWGTEEGPSSPSENNQIISNNISGNEVGIIVESDSSTNIIQFNRIVGNTECQLTYTGGENILNATKNWWGSNDEPTTGDGGQIEGMVNHSPWLYMTLVADPIMIGAGETSTLTVDFNNDYDGTIVTTIDPSDGHIPDGLDIIFASDSLGSVNPTTKTLNGIATTTYTAGNYGGISTVNATLSDQTVSTNVTIHKPADLTATDLNYPTSPYTGIPYTLSVIIRNIGLANSAAFDVTLKDNGTTVSTQRVNSGLNAGDFTTLYWYNWIPAIGTQGTHTLLIVVDTSAEIIESNESNNNLTNTTTAIGRPDLTPTLIITNSSNMYMGLPYTVNVTVANYGDANVGSFNVELFDGTTSLGTQNISNLAIGATSHVSFDWFPTTLGTHSLRAFADCFYVVFEIDENNNNLTENVNVLAIVDLIPTTIISNSSPMYTGLPYTINVTVWNNGTLAANTFNVTLFDGVTEVGQQIVTSLAPGYSTVVNFNWFPTTAGTHTLVAHTDTNNIVFENHENNNELTSKVDVTAIADLLADDLQISTPTYLNITTPITITIKNNGTANSEPFTVKLLDGTQGIAWIPVNSLTAGSTTTITYNWKPTTTGTHTLKTFVDSSSIIQEANESNNQKTWNITVITIPDLLATNLQITTPTYLNITTPITITIKNNGTANSEPFTVQLLDGTQGIAWIPVNSLTAGSTTTITYNWKPTTTGTHTLKTFVDSSSIIQEANESNNQKTWNITVVDLPDLLATNLQITTPTYLNITSTITITIKNNGTANSEPFTVKLLDGTQGIAWIPVNSLTAGSTTTITYNWKPTTTGTHTLKTFVDSSSIIQEANESNNQKTWNITVVDLPDLLATNLQITTPTYLNITTPITITIKNNGTANSEPFTVKLLDGTQGIAWIPVNSLTAGSTTTITYNWKPTTTGTHTLKTFVDSSSIIQEANESNNQKTWNITVITIPDILITKLQVSSPTYLNIVTPITITIKNNGTANSEPFTVKLLDGTQGKAWINIESLAAGTSTTIIYNWTPTTTGTHTIKAVADLYNQITESNETNNQKTEEITVQESDKPDLTITNIELPETPKVGETYTITVTIINNGVTDTTDSFTVKLLDGTQGIGWKTVTNLQAGNSTSTTFTWTPTTTGTHTLKVATDIYNTITESNESNNQEIRTIEVT